MEKKKDDGLTFLVLIDVKTEKIVGCEGMEKGKFERCKNCRIQKNCFVRLNYQFNKAEEAYD